MSNFKLPERYLNVNHLEIRPVDAPALIEKSLTFVKPTVHTFRVTDLSHFGRWNPFRLTVNENHLVVLMTDQLADNRKAMDYYVSILQHCVTLTCSTKGSDKPRYSLEVSEGLLVPDARRDFKMIETSSFCDILNSTLSYDRNKFRILIGLLKSFGPKLQASIEHHVMAKFPNIAPHPKTKSKNTQPSNSLKNTKTSQKAPPPTAMSEALNRAGEVK